VISLILIAPILVIMVLSFSTSRYLEFPPPGYSLRWYRNLFADESWRQSLLTSLEVALPVTVLATSLGTAASVGLVRWQSRAKDVLFSMTLTPMIVPSIVTAVAAFLLFARLHLNETRTALILSHTALAIPLVILSVSASLQGVDHSLELCARSLGAGPFSAFRKVTLPQIRSGILGGSLFAFITSFDEPVLALFVAGTRVVTLPKRMWDGIRYEIDPTVSAVSTLIVLFTSLLVLIAFQFSLKARTRRKMHNGATRHPRH
jgi:ABC-type spermidine/putrescine transport system permease subunit II